MNQETGAGNRRKMHSPLVVHVHVLECVSVWFMERQTKQQTSFVDCAIPLVLCLVHSTLIIDIPSPVESKIISPHPSIGCRMLSGALIILVFSIAHRIISCTHSHSCILLTPACLPACLPVTIIITSLQLVCSSDQVVSHQVGSLLSHR